MTQVVSFEDFTPAARFDALPWTEVRIEEAADSDGPWTLIDTIALSPLDADPSDPAARDFTTELATADGQWYRVIFADADGDVSAASDPIQNFTDDVTAYSTVDELFRILKIRNPSSEQTTAANRVLLTAAGEINAEIDRETGDDIAGWQLALAAEVNLERAVEHWRQQEAPFGLIGLGPEMGGAFTSKDSWSRHANKLAPLKGQWGLA